RPAAPSCPRRSRRCGASSASVTRSTTGTSTPPRRRTETTIQATARPARACCATNSCRSASTSPMSRWSTSARPACSVRRPTPAPSGAITSPWPMAGRTSRCDGCSPKPTSSRCSISCSPRTARPPEMPMSAAAKERPASRLYETGERNFDTLKRTYDAIEEIAVGELGLDTYPNQIEMISAEQMLDAYSSIGMPVFYSHWSFGKRFVRDEKLYRKGYTGLAYEIVINSDPCISYIMEENTMTMQELG